MAKTVSNDKIRNFIRHPVDIPIELVPQDNTLTVSKRLDNDIKIERMENVSFGGLMFQSSIPYSQNKKIIVKISSVTPPFEAQATVTWCQKSGRHYLVGLEFTDKETEFQIRMVEQVCHIMHYRNEVMATEGRALDNDEAAKEWIAQNASDFPK